MIQIRDDRLQKEATPCDLRASETSKNAQRELDLREERAPIVGAQRETDQNPTPVRSPMVRAEKP
jgi:hypothetical protein